MVVVLRRLTRPRRKGSVCGFGLRDRGEDVLVSSGLAGGEDAVVEAPSGKGHDGDWSAELVLEGEARGVEFGGKSVAIAVCEERVRPAVSADALT